MDLRAARPGDRLRVPIELGPDVSRDDLIEFTGGFEPIQRFLPFGNGSVKFKVRR